MSRAISIAGMLAVLFLSYGLDRIWEFLRQQNSRTFNVIPSLWFSGVLNLAFAAAILALAWFVLFKGDKSLILSLFYLLVGLLLLFSWALIAFVPTGLTPFFGRSSDLFLVSPSTYEYHAAAFVAMIGAVGMIRSARGWNAGTRAQTATRSV